MSNLSPKISIITVCLNSREFIEETIRSIRKQSYKNIEYIVIDGGSTDGTQDILKKCEKHIAYWTSEPDSGISDAFNKGLKASSGEIIGFMNSQDYYTGNQVIQKIIDVFEQNKTTKIVYGKTFYVSDDSTEIVGVMGERFSECKMKKRNIIPHQSVFVKREIFDEFGLFLLNFRFAMDYEHLLRVTKVYTPLFLDEGLAVMRLGGISDINKFAVCTELFRAQITNGEPLLSSVAALMYHYATSAGLKLLRLFRIYTLSHLYRKIGISAAANRGK